MTGTQVISNSAGLNGGGLFAVPAFCATDTLFDHNSAGDTEGISPMAEWCCCGHVTARRNGGVWFEWHLTLAPACSAAVSGEQRREAGGIAIVGNLADTFRRGWRAIGAGELAQL
jgi:hypothetical protein